MIYEVERNGEIVKVKKCIKCLKHKRVEAFSKFSHNRCKSCLNEYGRKRRAKIKSGEK